MSYAIQTEHLSRNFSSFKAVDNINLNVPEASVFGFLGPNGAGKTTTIRMLLGLIKADNGTVLLNGYSLHKQPNDALNNVGAIVETPALYPNLTGRENLKLSLRTHGGERSEIAPLIALVGLNHALDRRVSGYSLGMRQRQALARAMLNRPKLLILDEPTNGLDPAGIAEFRELVTSLPKRFGTTVFLSSHLLTELEQTASHCALLHHGQVIFQGSLKELEQQFNAWIDIESSQPKRVVEVLRAKDLDASIDQGKVRIHQPMNQSEREKLMHELILAGAPISGLSSCQPSLEEIFFKLTGANECALSGWLLQSGLNCAVH